MDFPRGRLTNSSYTNVHIHPRVPPQISRNFIIPHVGPVSCVWNILCLKSDRFRFNLRRKSEKFYKSESQLVGFDFIPTALY